MENYKIDVLLGLVRDEIRNIERGETSYGTYADDADQLILLREITDELTALKDAPLVVNLGGSTQVNVDGHNFGAINF